MKLKDLLGEEKAQIAQEFCKHKKKQTFKQKRDLIYALKELHSEQIEDGQGWQSRRIRGVIGRVFRQQWLWVSTGGSGVVMKGAEQSGQIRIYSEDYQAEFTDGLYAWCSRKVSRILA